MFLRLAGCGVEIMLPIFKTKVLDYQSKGNRDETILIGKITDH